MGRIYHWFFFYNYTPTLDTEENVRDVRDFLSRVQKMAWKSEFVPFSWTTDARYTPNVHAVEYIHFQHWKILKLKSVFSLSLSLSILLFILSSRWIHFFLIRHITFSLGTKHFQNSSTVFFSSSECWSKSLFPIWWQKFQFIH